MKIIARMLFVLLVTTGSVQARDMEITPFRTINQSPLTRIFGVPVETASTITPEKSTSFNFTQDIASSYAIESIPGEKIILDGESYVWTLAARYGVGNRFEAGINLPVVLDGGGFFDGFIVDWHNSFSLPQGGRDTAPKDRLRYSYSKNGVEKLRMDHSSVGIGDISFHGGMRLYDSQEDNSHDSLALRGSLKLPTGDSGSLRGSGSTDFTVSLCGSMNNFTEWGSLGLFASLGAMAMTNGDVLRDQQNNFAGFGTAGVGWGPAEWISFKIQLNGNTSLYHDTSLNALSDGSLMLVSGGALKLGGGYVLDIGVSEDVAVSTAPDVSLHFGLSKRF